MAAFTASSFDLIKTADLEGLQEVNTNTCQPLKWEFVTQSNEILILAFGLHLAIASRNANTQFRVSTTPHNHIDIIYGDDRRSNLMNTFRIFAGTTIFSHIDISRIQRVHRILCAPCHLPGPIESGRHISGIIPALAADPNGHSGGDIYTKTLVSTQTGRFEFSDWLYPPIRHELIVPRYIIIQCTCVLLCWSCIPNDLWFYLSPPNLCWS